MKIKSILFVLFCISINAYSQKNTALFNGENFEGWYAFEAKSGVHQDPSNLFKIEDQMLRFQGKKLAYLMTQNSYENFELHLDFRWNTDSTFVRRSQKKNSGVMYLIPSETEDKLWPKGIQFQVKEGNTGDFILIDGYTLEVSRQKVAGKNLITPRLKDAANPVGEWNHISITSRKGEIIQKLNGQIVNQGKAPLVTKGKILLQYEGYPIDFKNIEIIIFEDKLNEK
ncbi:DUF1080 domain-containing protein [Flammeovirga sp. OC4]|uniref:3-keto-disaccharide hydrolase n=1 Tax=Flammeovirga sp. OC4 TaxID=1382345 RepID=UPI0005C73E7F|nr:DUF1080 domain-containing protein [Flammeovirga sp. OC4]